MSHPPHDPSDETGGKMRVESIFDHVKMVRTHKVSGVVNLPEFREVLQGIYAHRQFNPDMNALWDLRHADFAGVAPEDVRSLMQIVVTNWNRNGRCRAAIVVAGMAPYGISRMYESQFGVAAPCKIKVFLDVNLAWKWFEASDDTVDAMASRPLRK